MKQANKETRSTSQGAGRASQYAAAEEFCAIFERNMTRLYSLSLWLTANHAKAEQCFLGALDDSRKATGVFREWAESWSRLAVIENAIRLVKPTAFKTTSDDQVPEGTHPDAIQVMRLNAFDRFVYVLSVLDRYSTRDCAILLRCKWQDIERAKRRAIEVVSKAGQQVLSSVATVPTALQLDRAV